MAVGHLKYIYKDGYLNCIFIQVTHILNKLSKKLKITFLNPEILTGIIQYGKREET